MVKAVPKEKKNEENEHLKLIEAALYVAGRPLNIRKLGSVTGLRSKKTIDRLIHRLIDDYRKRETPLEILELEDQRYVMQLKPIYTEKVRRLAVKPLLSLGPLKTLSYVALRQPVSQPQVIAVRGKHAYRHLKELEKMDLIQRTKKGNEVVIVTTDFFADYFGLSHKLPLLKRQLKRRLVSEGTRKRKKEATDVST